MRDRESKERLPYYADRLIRSLNEGLAKLGSGESLPERKVSLQEKRQSGTSLDKGC